MHKIILIAILLITSLDCFSQDVKISNFNLKYDENFSPYIEVKFTNNESRTITTIIFGVCYRNIHDYNYTDMKNVTVQANIMPHQTKTLTFSVPNRSSYEPYELALLRVRYTDGTTGGFIDEYERLSKQNRDILKNY